VTGVQTCALPIFKEKNDYDKFNFNFKKYTKIKTLISMMELEVNDKYYYTNRLKIWDVINTSIVNNISTGSIYQYRRYYVRENKNKICPTLTANMGSGGHNVPLIKDNKGIRKLTPRECFNLQGFPLSYNIDNISDAGLYKLAGNAVSIPIVFLIANKIIDIVNSSDNTTITV
jgi:DNA (cytosine-5)-methyltransferase 1